MRDKIASIFCALFRHSHLVTNCMGYKYCARCATQLGDTVGGVGLPAGKGGYFGIGQLCQCESCRQAFDTLTWVDRFMCPKAVWPTDEFVASENRKHREIMDSLIKNRLAREAIRIVVLAGVVYVCWLARP